MTQKAAKLDLKVARKLLTDGTFFGMTRAGAFNGFVKGYLDRANGEVNWEELVSEIKELAGVDTIGLINSYGSASITIASNWAKEDLNAAMAWYVYDSLRDYGNSFHCAQVASILGLLPSSEIHRAVDWIGKQRDQEGWNDTVIQEYAGHMALRLDFLGTEVERLLGFLPDEMTRSKFVDRFVTAKNPGGKERKFTDQELVRLIDASGFSDAQTSASLRKIKLSK